MNVWLICVCILIVGAVAMAADLNHPHGFDPKFKDVAEWEKRAAFLRHQARVAQGLWPMPPRTELKPVIHGKIEREGYTIEKVFFASLPGHYVSGNLYRPREGGGKRPVVLMPYGHWPNGRFIWNDDEKCRKEIDSGAEKLMEAARSPLQANCVHLARSGCIVFHFDLVGFADSTKIEHREGFTDTEAILRLQSFMGLQSWNAIRALDFVLTLPHVDEKRVAVTGSSGGGTQSIGLAALDPRVAVSFPMVMVSMNMQGGCICENAPLYRIFTNNVELACLFAPKPHGAAAANDWTKDFMTRGLPEMKSIWRLYGAEDRVDGVHVNFGHNHNLPSRQAQYRFLAKHLKVDVPQEEKPFEPVPPKELSVYDDQHPMPADATDAAGVRKWMTRASDEQLSKLSDEEYVKIVRTALAAMIVDELPAASQVVHEGDHLFRRGDHRKVSVKVALPSNDSGDVVVCAGLNSTDVQRLVGAGRTAVVVEIADIKRPEIPKRSEYPGFDFGYNRSTVAEHAHDLLTAIAFARGMEGAKSVDLIGRRGAGPAALLARALAGDAVRVATIDLQRFDFDQVAKDDDPMLLPGALKYGGVGGLLPLCDSGQTLLFHPPTSKLFKKARKAPNVAIEGQLTPRQQ